MFELDSSLLSFIYCNIPYGVIYIIQPDNLTILFAACTINKVV